MEVLWNAITGISLLQAPVWKENNCFKIYKAILTSTLTCGNGKALNGGDSFGTNRKNSSLFQYHLIVYRAACSRSYSHERVTVSPDFTISGTFMKSDFRHRQSVNRNNLSYLMFVQEVSKYVNLLLWQIDL